MSEKLELPSGWRVLKLGEVCDRITKGGTPTTYGFAFVSRGINFIKVENIEYGKVNLETIRHFITVEAHNNQKKSQLEENDLLFSIAGTIGEICLIKKEYLPANTNQALAILRGYGKYVYPNFLTFQLNSSLAQIVKAKARGGAMNNISLEDLKEIDLVVPPLPEQHRIVEKIEALFSELDNGVEQLKTAQQQLKVYRQAVLKWAFEGRLTNDNIKNGDLPEGWKYQTLGDTLSFVGSGVTPKGGQAVYQSSGIIFIRSQNVYPNKLELVNVAYISNKIDEKMKRTRVKPDDVLLNITGASIGRCAYIPQKFPKANVNQHVCILRPIRELLDHVYLSNYLNSSRAQKEIMNSQGGATRQGLNFQQIRKFSIPIPLLEEQHQIVQEIETRLSVCDKLEETITASLQQAEALRQSILKKAFEGKLAPQNPNDEPASVLLEKIREEKGKIKNITKKEPL